MVQGSGSIVVSKQPARREVFDVVRRVDKQMFCPEAHLELLKVRSNSLAGLEMESIDRHRQRALQRH
jgi:hypothetical protein